MTVSAIAKPLETEETVLDAMIRAGAKQGYGYEDIYVEIKAAGVKIERDYVRSIVIPKTHVGLQQGQPLEADFPQGHRRGT